MEIVNPTQLRTVVLDREKTPTGSTVFCHNPKPIICKTIRFGIGSYWDHASTVVWYQCGITGKWEPYIVEAVGGLEIWPVPFEQWLAKRQDNMFGVSACTVDLERIENEYGKLYDFNSVLFFMVIFRSTEWAFGKGLWIGPKNEKASTFWFCFELTAWFRQLPNWWRRVPPPGNGDFD